MHVDAAMLYTHILLGVGLILNIFQVYMSRRKSDKQHKERMARYEYQHDMMWSDYKIRFNITNGDHD